MVFQLLADELIFPDPALSDPDGLLAIGGDLSVDRLLLAYQTGIFPWFSEGEPILWFAPKERCVIYPNLVSVSKSMRKIMQNGVFHITVNKVFADVIANCAKIPRAGQDGTWITDEMQHAYIALHKKGVAYSIEVWQNSKLVGGLYGVKIGKVFCGESMFSHISNASKTALIYLCQQMDFDLIDCQLPNDHLMSMGAEMISGNNFLKILNSK